MAIGDRTRNSSARHPCLTSSFQYDSLRSVLKRFPHEECFHIRQFFCRKTPRKDDRLRKQRKWEVSEGTELFLRKKKALAGTSARRGVPASRIRRTVNRRASRVAYGMFRLDYARELSPSSFQPAGWHAWICLMRKKGFEERNPDLPPFPSMRGLKGRRLSVMQPPDMGHIAQSWNYPSFGHQRGYKRIRQETHGFHLSSPDSALRSSITNRYHKEMYHSSIFQRLSSNQNMKISGNDKNNGRIATPIISVLIIYYL